jgi:hypothetical protein
MKQDRKDYIIFDSTGRKWQKAPNTSTPRRSFEITDKHLTNRECK